MRASTFRLAPGVALFAVSTGILARTRQKWLRVDLHERAREHQLVSLLAQGEVALEKADPPGVRALRQTGLGDIAESAEPVQPGLDGWQAGLPEHVLCGAPDDATLGATLTTRVREGRISLVVWSDERGLVLAGDDGRTRGCPLCAWHFDSALARYAVPGIDLAGAPRAYADAHRFRAAARSLVDDILAAPSDGPGPSEVWTVETPSGATLVRRVPAHPSCVCAARETGAPIPVRTLDWATAATHRHPAVWPVDVGGEERAARVVYRKARDPWLARPDALGVALAGGPDSAVRALGEAIERFAFLHAPPSTWDRRATALEAPALDASEIQGLLFRPDEYAQPGFRFAAYRPDDPQDWCVAMSLPGGEVRSVPASLVGRGPRGARALVDPSSNGYAAHLDREQAIDSALLELIERDAILLHWYAPVAPPLRLEAASDIPGAQALLMTQDIDLPVVLTVAPRQDGSLRCGSAAATTLENALARASSELRVALGGGTRIGGEGPLVDVQARYGPDDHLGALAGESGRRALEAMMRGAIDPPAGLSGRWPLAVKPRTAILAALTRSGLKAWVVDRSLPDVFGEGWRVVRALVPGLVELSWGMPYRRLASPRLARRLAAGAELSSTPHPIA